MNIKFSEINFENLGKCIKAENSLISMIFTVDVGPRIISYSLLGKENVMFVDSQLQFKNDSDELHKVFETDENWYIYGGHRLWSSPERYPESYVPDNFPVEYKLEENQISLTPPPTKTGEQHEIIVTFFPNSSNVEISHKITNSSQEILNLSPWALTVLTSGGVEIFPQTTKETGLLSNRRNVLWAYTDINDSRYYSDNNYATLQQVTGTETAFKIGTNNEDGWAAYLVNQQLFVKRFPFNSDGEYPDFGCNFETYTNGLFLECESLGQLTTLAPNESTTLVERWEINAVSESFNPKSANEIENFVAKYITKE